MTASSRLSEVKNWLLSPREDMELAEAIVAQGIGRPRHACFAAQQAAEKTLKAALFFERVPVTRGHDLDELRDRLPAHWTVKTSHPSFGRLIEFAVQVRYPDGQVTVGDTDARVASQQAQEVWDTITSDLRRSGFDVDIELP